MEVTVRSGNLATRAAGAIAIGVFEGERRLGGAAAALDRATRGAIAKLVASGDFTGRFLELEVLHPPGVRAKRLLVVGLGAKSAVTPHRMRQVAGVVARRARALECRTLATVVHGAGAGGLDVTAAAQAAAEGAVLGHYRFTRYRTDAGAPPLRRVELVEIDAARARGIKAAAARGVAWGEATCFARDLAMTPGQDLTPADLAGRAQRVGKATGTRVTVLGPAQMERLGMGAVLAVGRGSPNPPRFIVLERGLARGRKAVKPVVVIGKGVTFDTGGISLKPRDNMHKMKYDMGGAAAVLGFFAALPSVDPPFPVVGLIPSAENMPGGAAFKPGDVIRAFDGTTIEVTNTDAEGRLLLADALGYARRYQPEAVIDLATLTGAITIALGAQAAGLFTADDALARELTEAGERAGERLWRMPLWEEYLADLKSDTADFTNSSGSTSGASAVAAAFLQHFAKPLRWAHLDIASTGWTTSERPLDARGPTGFGVRLLLEWISSRAGGGGRAGSSAAGARRAARSPAG